MSEIDSTPVEGTPSAAPEAAAPASDPVLDRVNELAGTVGSLVDRFGQVEQHFQPQPEPEEDPWSALFPQEAEPDPYAQQPQGLDPAQLQQIVEQRIQDGIQQGISPIQQQLQQMQLQRD